MIAASHNAQGWTRAGAGEAPDCGGMGKLAPVAVHQSNCRHSSRRLGRQTSLGRPNWRGCQRTSPFFFAPRSTDPDEIHELRICELTGRQAVISSRVLQSFPDQAGGQAAVPGKSHLERLSCVALDDEQHEPKGVVNVREVVGEIRNV